MLTYRLLTLERIRLSKESLSVEATSSNLTENKLQVCVCGWQKVTTRRGLRIHQGKMKCLVGGRQGTRIDSYFLRSASSQSVEVKRQEVTHSSQDISTPDVEVDSSTEAESETSQPKREKTNGHRPRVRWPGAAEVGHGKMLIVIWVAFWVSLKGQLKAN